MPTDRWKRWAGLGLLTLLLVPLAGGALEQRSWTIESFDVLIEIDRDGSLRVTETIQPRFVGRYNGIFRTIPIDYDGPGGFNYRLFLDLESITDESGRALKYESSREGHYRKFKVWIPGAENATKTVVLRYRVENGLRFFDDHDELYWNATGTEWPVPIERAQARVVLPAEASGSVRAVAYTGAWGATASDADVDIGGSEVRFRTRRGLNYREGLTVVVGWAKGVVPEPSRAERAAQTLRSNWVLLVPVFVFAGMFWLWHTRGRDPELNRSIMPLYAPPEGLTPAELGMLADNSPDMRDITATLVDLAVRGYVLIEETEREVLFWSKKDYRFHLRKPRGEWWKELKAHERELLEELFADGDEVSLSSLENQFYKTLPGLRKAITNQLIAKGYYDRDPQKVKKTWMVIGAVVLGAAFFVVAPATGLGISPAAAIAAMLLNGGIILGFGWFMPARTRKGVDAWAGVRGFEEFLARAEKDRLERMVTSPELFEKYLPFAMALGVERNWTRAFEDIYRRPPDWYRGDWTGDFRVSRLTNDLQRMSSRAATTFASAPRSSSGGSGFGGGGFSGGGFGGGGGGAF